ncbi:hypothetical protein DCC62_03055 [candidate division KSB1 bacterium]|nr:MAG: hypothetical protein DCC62_03055 [candidate division KSB1 bacterium]
MIKLKSVLKAVLMTTSDKISSNAGLKEYVDIEKSADILQATFQHYFNMAMDHNAKAATTTNILLVVVGAIIAIIGHDNEIKGLVDSGGAIAVCVIGIFGVVWVRKQQERYHYWQSIALQYQEELIKIVPVLKTRDTYEKHAENVAAEEVGPILARRIYERHLWVTLHIIVVILGLGLFLISMKE